MFRLGNDGEELAADLARLVSGGSDAEVEARAEEISFLLSDGVAGEIDELDAGMDEGASIRVAADGGKAVTEVEGIE
jgi:hypothetical protein